MPESTSATVTPAPKLAEGVSPSVLSRVLTDGAVTVDVADQFCKMSPAARPLGETYESSEQPSRTDDLHSSSSAADSFTANAPMLGNSASMLAPFRASSSRAH